MLNRQKTILEFTRVADRPIQKLELMKWAFLLRTEYATMGGNAFYDFLPYHFGPYSFSMDREVGSLVNEGYLRSEDNTWAQGRTPMPDSKLSSSLVRDVQRIVRRFGNYSTEDLLDYVYTQHPSYTINSKRKQLARRKIATPQVYTAGYEGLQVDGFLNLLIQNGIQRLLDVRRNPIARRFGFHKSTLQRLCNNINIEYVHIPELGISSEQRRSLETKSDYVALFQTYADTTLQQELEAVKQVAKLTQEKPSVLVCMEEDHRYCHRSRLADSVSQITGLQIVHLGK